MSNKAGENIREVLPTKGLLFQQEVQSFVLCKPKLMPLKSVTLEKLERMQREAEEKIKAQMNKEDENQEQWS